MFCLNFGKNGIYEFLSYKSRKNFLLGAMAQVAAALVAPNGFAPLAPDVRVENFQVDG